MEFLLMAGIGIGAYYLYQHLQKQQEKSKDPRLDDDELSVNEVVEMLQEFRPNAGDEGQIQVQLKNFFQKRIRHIQKEHGIEGKLRIDFHLGSRSTGEGIGVEVKMAKSLMAASAYHRMLGQVREYLRTKYDDDNLIIAVVTNKTLSKENYFVEKLEEDMEELGATLVWVRTKEKTPTPKA